jgi:GT2 family glycosyltransferase
MTFRLGQSGLVYGVCTPTTEDFDRFAAPSIRMFDPDAPVLVRYQQESIHAAYNSLIDEARGLNAIGLVLLHDDVQIQSQAGPSDLAEMLSDPSVGIIGVIGASNVHSLEWWWYEGRGRVEETEMVVDFGPGTHDVAVVDGLFLALSRAAMEFVRLLPGEYPGYHGYDAEMCSQVLDHGLRVLVADIEVFHHSFPHGKITDTVAHAQADRMWRKRWRGGIAHHLLYRRAVVRHDWRKPLSKLRRVMSP